MGPIVVFESVKHFGQSSRHVRRIAWDGQGGLTFHSYSIGPRGGLQTGTATGFTIDEIKQALSQVDFYLDEVEKQKEGK